MYMAPCAWSREAAAGSEAQALPGVAAQRGLVLEALLAELGILAEAEATPLPAHQRRLRRATGRPVADLLRIAHHQHVLPDIRPRCHAAHQPGRRLDLPTLAGQGASGPAKPRADSIPTEPRPRRVGRLGKLPLPPGRFLLHHSRAAARLQPGRHGRVDRLWRTYDCRETTHLLTLSHPRRQ